jgi:hypothetical protein
VKLNYAEEKNMINDKMKITGKVRSTVLGPDGNPRMWSPSREWMVCKDLSRLHKAFSIYYFVRFLIRSTIDILVQRPMVSEIHNIVTDQGDALIADLMSETPARTKVDNTNGYIEVGTAYSATGAKAQTGCHTATGSRHGMEATYPKQKGSFGAANDNVVQYRAIWAAGTLEATINEASMHNASTSGDCLSYGQVSPAAAVQLTDTLQIDWELTFLGA